MAAPRKPSTPIAPDLRSPRSSWPPIRAIPWQRDLAVSATKVGNVLAKTGRREEALASYRHGLAIAEKLAALDPGNTEWQRDLSITFERIGAVLLKTGRRAEAVDAFRRALAIRETLAAADAGNALWQPDLVISLVQVARLGDDPRARLTRALDITQRLDRERKLNANQKGWIGMIGHELARLPR